jgi:hypothetical protein
MGIGNEKLGWVRADTFRDGKEPTPRRAVAKGLREGVTVGSSTLTSSLARAKINTTSSNGKISTVAPTTTSG